MTFQEAVLERRVEAVEYAVLDTETTGLSPSMGHRICEVGIVAGRVGEEPTRLQGQVNPERPSDHRALAVHGLTDERLRHCPKFAKIAHLVKDRLDGRVVVGWNTGFDIRFLAAEWRRLQWDPLDVLVLDAQRLIKNVLRPHGLSLGIVAELMEIDLEAHKADDDAMATWLIFEQLLKDREDYEIETVGDLLQMQGKPITWPASLWEDPGVPEAIRDALKGSLPLSFRYAKEDGRTMGYTGVPLDVCGNYLILRIDGRPYTFKRELIRRATVVS